MTSELLHQVRVVDPVSNLDQVNDVLIVEGVIQAIAPHISEVPENTQIFDRPGLVLGPGLVDLYSHSGEPGFESRETLTSLLQSATAGGFTRLTLLPDTEPALDQPAGCEWMRSQLAQQPQPQPYLNLWGALTLKLQGEQMTELAELAAAGVVGFTDGKPLSDWVLVRRLLEYLGPLDKPIAVWPCDRQLRGNGVSREGFDATRLGLPGNPAIAETSALAALLECVAAIPTPVHLMRISTARSVELIRAAKQEGLPITASTTWMHLLLNSQSLESYDPNLRIEPPLGNPADQAALLTGLKEGTIDAIAIDHTPYTYEEKTVAFADAPPGAIGLELALPLLWQGLIAADEWNALSLWRSLSSNPARCLQQPPPRLEVGLPAELVLFDPNQSWTVSRETLKSRSSNTPWFHQALTGRVTRTWVPASVKSWSEDHG